MTELSFNRRKMWSNSVWTIFIVLAIWNLPVKRAHCSVVYSDNFTTPGDQNRCGGTFSAYQYIISSPSYSEGRSKTRDCIYVLQGSPLARCNQEFHLQFLEFSLKPSERCSNDYLRIGYNDVLCGNVVGIRKFQGVDNSLKIVYHSSGNDVGGRFKILVTTLPCSSSKVDPKRDRSFDTTTSIDSDLTTEITTTEEDVEPSTTQIFETRFGVNDEEQGSEHFNPAMTFQHSIPQQSVYQGPHLGTQAQLDVQSAYTVFRPQISFTAEDTTQSTRGDQVPLKIQTGNAASIEQHRFPAVITPQSPADRLQLPIYEQHFFHDKNCAHSSNSIVNSRPQITSYLYLPPNSESPSKIQVQNTAPSGAQLPGIHATTGSFPGLVNFDITEPPVQILLPNAAKPPVFAAVQPSRNVGPVFTQRLAVNSSLQGITSKLVGQKYFGLPAKTYGAPGGDVGGNAYYELPVGIPPSANYDPGSVNCNTNVGFNGGGGATTHYDPLANNYPSTNFGVGNANVDFGGNYPGTIDGTIGTNFGFNGNGYLGPNVGFDSNYPNTNTGVNTGPNFDESIRPTPGTAFNVNPNSYPPIDTNFGVNTNYNPGVTNGPSTPHHPPIIGAGFDINTNFGNYPDTGYYPNINDNFDFSFGIHSNGYPSTTNIDPGTGYYPGGSGTTNINGQCCNGVYSSDRFLITTPGFPTLFYSSDTYDCRYTIARSSPNVCQLRLNFKFFYVGSEDRFCAYGYLELDGRRICGCKTGYSLVSSFSNYATKTISLRYLGYPRVKFNGFLIEVVQEPCPGYYGRSRKDVVHSSQGSSSVLGSRSVSSSSFERNEEEDEGKTEKEVDEVIALKGKVESSENKSGRSKRHLGYSYPKPSFGLVSGGRQSISTGVGQIGENLQWNNCQALVFFHWAVAAKEAYLKNARCSSSLISSPGGTHPITSVIPIFPTPGSWGNYPAANCQGVNVVEGTISSPLYPNNYPNNVNTCYRFYKAPGYCQLELAILDFDLENSIGCAKDYVAFSGQKRRYCGTSLAGSRTIFDMSRSRIADMYFFSDSSGTGRGFRAGFSQIPCQGQMTIRMYKWSYLNKLSGNKIWHRDILNMKIGALLALENKCNTSAESECILERREIQGLEVAPVLEPRSPKNLTCSYAFIRKDGYCTLRLEFSEFDLSNSKNCEEAYIILRGKRYCGKSLEGITLDLPSGFGVAEEIPYFVKNDVEFLRWRFSYKYLPCKE